MLCLQLQCRQLLYAQQACSSIWAAALQSSSLASSSLQPLQQPAPSTFNDVAFQPYSSWSSDALQLQDCRWQNDSRSVLQSQSAEEAASHRFHRTPAQQNVLIDSSQRYQRRPQQLQNSSCIAFHSGSWGCQRCNPCHAPYAACLVRHSDRNPVCSAWTLTAGTISLNKRPFTASSSASSVLSGDSSTGSSSPSWVNRCLPQQMRPYAHLMRLDKPIGSWLLAWPGLWTIAMAAPPGHLPDVWLTSLFGVGAVLMRGAGCTVNDLWDQDIDKRVERTRSRPLAAGAVTQNAALAFLVAQLLASFTILLQLNTYTQVLGWCSLALVGTYPLMKRVTWWPQAFLGLCMNYGVLMGYSAAHGSCDWSVVLPMYAAGISWTLVYDTIYAHQDKKDDAQIGVKSTALLFGDRTKTWSTGFATLQTLGLLAAGNAAGMGLPYYAAVSAGAAHQAWQIGTVDLNNGPDCMAKFVSNKWYGAILYAGIVVDRLLAVS